MRIVTKLIFAASVSVAVLVLSAVILWQTTVQVREQLSTLQLTRDLANGLGALRYLTLEYSFYREDRVEAQWKLKHASVEKLLMAIKSTPADEDRALSGLRTSYDTLQRLFFELTQSETQPSVDREHAALQQALARRLNGQLMAKMEIMASAADNLARKSRADAVAVLESALTRVVLFGGLLAAAASGLLFGTFRSIMKPLVRLREGSAIVGGGNLSHRIGLTANDEMGALSRSFDRMTAHLQESLGALKERNTQLVGSNKELETFAYSVSHDLRAPLRAIDGFSQALLEDYEAKLDDEGKDHLHRVREASQRMGRLIDDMLKLSRSTRGEMDIEPVDLSAIAESVTAELRNSARARHVAISIAPAVTAQGDPRLLEAVMENLLSNAWKFTAKKDGASIEFGAENNDGEVVCHVRDNGAGFDMAYGSNLFEPFQRLHRSTEFAGNGIGLATVKRIIARLGGRVWAEGAVDKGATFYFTLPAAPYVRIANLGIATGRSR